jgi:hypothetical protein
MAFARASPRQGVEPDVALQMEQCQPRWGLLGQMGCQEIEVVSDDAGDAVWIGDEVLDAIRNQVGSDSFVPVGPVRGDSGWSIVTRFLGRQATFKLASPR